MEQLNKKTGDKIRKIRIKLGYTIEQLANKCDLSISYISDIELGKKSPSLKTLYAITKSLNCSLYDFLDFTKEKNGDDIIFIELKKMLSILNSSDQKFILSMIRQLIKRISE